MAASDLTLRSWLTSVKSIIEATGLVLSPAPFSVSATPSGLVDKAFTIDLQSANTNKYRESDGHIRLGHTLTVTIAKLVRPLDQFTSQLDGLDIEERVIGRVLDRTVFPDVQVKWVDTRRVLTSSREHIITAIVFDLEHDWYFINLA